MKAMIFAAGLGTRLRPLTDSLPKALVPVGGVPMLERVILRLKAAGFDDITVNIHHFGGQIIDFLEANGHFGITLHISDERGELLDTGGGIKKARHLLEGSEPFLVHNADILTDLDLAGFYRSHTEGRAMATLLVNQRDSQRQLLFDAENRLQGWMNTATGETRPEGFSYQPSRHRPWAFGGIHVISPEVFGLMESGQWQGKFSIIPFYLSVCRQTRILASPRPGIHWFDIGKPDTLAEAGKWIEGMQ